MKQFLQVFKKPENLIRGSFIPVVLMLLVWLLPLNGSAQINSEDHYILITGQLNNNVNGAPVTDHLIYIEADSSLNNGFSYTAIMQTDINGFYYDTIITHENNGELNIYLYDFNDNLKEAQENYRFLWSNKFNIIANFEIFDPNATSSFQANFVAEPDTFYNDPMRINFHDLSIGYVIKSWLWEYGDGTTSELQDSWHVYSDPGIYKVTLSVTSKKPENEYWDTSRITKQVEVGLEKYFDMGGQVFAGHWPIDYGLAYLYAIDSINQLVPIDTTSFDQYGYYFFNRLPQGQYVTKARLQYVSELYGQFMPTYFGNTYIWNDASIINLTDTSFQNDIHLIPSIGQTSGKGQIIGQITYDTASVFSGFLPAGDVEILLLNDGNVCLTCGLSDIQGNFLFGNLAFGTYQIYPDVTGVPTSPMFVTISEAKPVASDVSLVISKEEITFSVPENPSEFVEGLKFIYPNPVKEQAGIQVRMKKASQLEMLVSDVTGRIVKKQSFYLGSGDQIISLDAAGFSQGTYCVNIYAADGARFSSKFVKIK